MLPVLLESTRFQSAAHSAWVIFVAPVDFDDGEVVWANAAPAHRPKATAVLPTRMALRISCSFSFLRFNALGRDHRPHQRDGFLSVPSLSGGPPPRPLLNDVSQVPVRSCERLWFDAPGRAWILLALARLWTGGRRVRLRGNLGK